MVVRSMIGKSWGQGAQHSQKAGKGGQPKREGSTKITGLSSIACSMEQKPTFRQIPSQSKLVGLAFAAVATTSPSLGFQTWSSKLCMREIWFVR